MYTNLQVAMITKQLLTEFSQLAHRTWFGQLQAGIY